MQTSDVESTINKPTFVSYLKPKKNKFVCVVNKYNKTFTKWKRELAYNLFFPSESDSMVSGSYKVLDGKAIRSKVIKYIDGDEKNYDLGDIFNECNFSVKVSFTPTAKTLFTSSDICHCLSFKVCQEKYRGRTREEMIHLESIGWELKDGSCKLLDLEEEQINNWDNNGFTEVKCLELRKNENYFLLDDEVEFNSEAVFHEEYLNDLRDSEFLRKETFTGLYNSKGILFNEDEASYLSYIGFRELNIPDMIQCVYCEKKMLKQSKGVLSEAAIKSCHNENCPSLIIMEEEKSRVLLSKMLKNSIDNRFSLRRLLNI